MTPSHSHSLGYILLSPRMFPFFFLIVLFLFSFPTPSFGDKFPIAYHRDEASNSLVFGEPKFVRAIGMYAQRDSSWGNSFSSQHPSWIQLKLRATELTEELRIVDPFENLDTLNETITSTTPTPSSLPTPEEAARKFLDDLDYPTSDYSQPGFIQGHILLAQDLDLVGLPDADNPLTSIETYCCTPFYVDQGLCSSSDLGTLIIDRNVSSYEIWSFDIPLMPRQADVVLRSGAPLVTRYIERQTPTSFMDDNLRDSTYRIRHTGEHVLLLSHCDPTLNTEVDVTGITEWKNPFGYLPGRLYGFLNFHKYMAFFYLLFGLLWASLNIRYWKDLSALQHSTSFVIFLCLLEQIVWYCEYSYFNREGNRHYGLLTTAILLSSARQTISRMLIVAVSCGYKIVRPTIGENRIRLIVLGSLYFLLECSLEFIVRYQQTHAMNDYYRIVLTFPLALFNAIFYWWIFISLYQLMVQLEKSKSEVKFMVYRQFTNILILTVVAGVVFAIYQAFYMLTDQFAWHWSYLWIVDGGFAFLLYTILLVSIALLFRPSDSNIRIIYAPVGMEDEDSNLAALADEDINANSIAMTKPSM